MIAGTATVVAGGVNRHQQEKAAQQQAAGEQAAPAPQAAPPTRPRRTPTSSSTS